MTTELGQFSLDRMVRAVEKVRERLLHATDALNRAGIAYAVAGGNAVAAWVSRVDEAAVRNTRDVDILVRREDLEAIKVALNDVGFVYRHSSGLDLFLDGPDAKTRDAVHLVYSGEMVRPGEVLSNPDVAESEMAESFRILSIPALVQLNLTAFGDQDRTHIRDLIDVGLIDETWCDKYPPALANRLRGILQTPEG
jgi:hypothetical protein